MISYRYCELRQRRLLNFSRALWILSRQFWDPTSNGNCILLPERVESKKCKVNYVSLNFFLDIRRFSESVKVRNALIYRGEILNVGEAAASSHLV